MVGMLTGEPCEPINGGNHFMFYIDYRKHNDVDYVAAVCRAVEGRTGNRLLQMKDNPDKRRILVRVGFVQTKNV